MELLRDFYESEYLEDYKWIHEDLRGLGRNMESFFRQSSVQGGALLDVGCGNGAFLEEAQRRGFSVWGIDFDAKSVAACQKKGLKNVEYATLENFIASHPELRGTFDVVTFFEVLEHQDQPRQFVRQVKQLLKHNGLAVCSLPNRKRLATLGLKMFARGKDAAWMYRLSKHDFPPHHLTWWSAASLRSFFNTDGWKDVTIVYLRSPYSERRNWWENVLAKVHPSSRRGHRITAGLLAVMPFGFALGLYCQARAR